MYCEVKSCVFLRNRSIIKIFLTSKCCFRLKYKSLILISTEKRSESGEKSAQIKHRLQWKHFKTNMWMDFDVRGQRRLHCRNCYYVLLTYILSTTVFKCINDGFASYKHATFCITCINWCCGLLVMFLSAVILTAPIHCRASTGEQVMQCSKSVLIYIFDGLREITFSFLLELLTPT